MPPLFSSLGRKPTTPQTPATVGRLHAVHETLRSPGRPLDDGARAFMEPRFGHDFSGVRVHADSQARESALALDARAYTMGRDIVFREGPPSLHAFDDRRLLAHELTHVVQQRGHSANTVSFESQSGDRFEREADTVAAEINSGSAARVTQHATAPFLGRDNKKETAAVLKQGTVAKTGLQFFPLQVTNTRIGPVSGEGGLALNTSTNLIVIVGPNMSLRRLAEILLPLWNSAAPFTPAGASAPLANPPLTMDVLARGLLVYNRYYLGVGSQPAPAMTGWSGGLRFPLPVEIDPTSGEAVVNSDLIRDFAGEFDAAWEPLLDQPAATLGKPVAADVATAARDFLTANPDAEDRGSSLAARSLMNPVEALPLVTAVFDQVGTQRFEVALAFMDFSVNADIGLLASQKAGAGILGLIRTALTTPPATLSTEQQKSLTRASLMLDLVKGAVARDLNPAKACPVAALTPLTDPDALTMEGGQTVVWTHTATALQPAADDLVARIQAAGGTASIQSAYRPAAYQSHLRQVWDKANDLDGNTSLACAALKREVTREMTHHSLAIDRPVGKTSNHTAGRAVDISWTLPAGTTSEESRIDDLADEAGLVHRLHAADRPHFELP